MLQNIMKLKAPLSSQNICNKGYIFFTFQRKMLTQLCHYCRLLLLHILDRICEMFLFL